MDVIFQPHSSHSCGQHCVAMITGVPVERVIKIMGVSGGTNPGDVINALRYFGFTTSNDLIRLKGLPPDLCIIQIRWAQGGGHWVVYKNGWVYCPGWGKFRFSYTTYGTRKGVPTSYVRIDKK